MSDQPFPSFEAWVESESGGWADGGTCTGCHRKAARLTAGIQHGKHRTDQGYCEWCMRYFYGYDQAEAKVAHALIYGAVREAIKHEIPFSLIRTAVDQARADDYEAEIGRHVAARFEAAS